MIEEKCVYWAVRTKSWTLIEVNSGLQKVNIDKERYNYLDLFRLPAL
jgi:hypothetical protein